MNNTKNASGKASKLNRQQAASQEIRVPSVVPDRRSHRETPLIKQPQLGSVEQFAFSSISGPRAWVEGYTFSNSIKPKGFGGENLPSHYRFLF